MSETACVTYDRIESKSHMALGVMGYIRWCIDSTKARALVIGGLVFVNEVLRRMSLALTTENFEAMSEEQKSKLIALLRSLVLKLNEVRFHVFAEGASLPFGCKRSLMSICDHTEDIEDALESFELAMNPRFKKIVDFSVASLSLPRGSSVAGMRR